MTTEKRIPEPKDPTNFTLAYDKDHQIHVHRSYLSEKQVFVMVNNEHHDVGTFLTMDEARDLITALQWRVAWYEQENP